MRNSKHRFPRTTSKRPPRSVPACLARQLLHLTPGGRSQRPSTNRSPYTPPLDRRQARERAFLHSTLDSSPVGARLRRVLPLLRLREATEAEVRDSRTIPQVQQYVLRLQVPMDNAPLSNQRTSNARKAQDKTTLKLYCTGNIWLRFTWALLGPTLYRMMTQVINLT